jgi:DNA-binding CsgD family transcriptional regulator
VRMRVAPGRRSVASVARNNTAPTGADARAGAPQALTLLVMSTLADRPTQLFGRAEELAAIDAILESASTGGVLVIRGEAGVGKSALLDHARDAARGRGMRVLATAGAETEIDLAYASLHRLLRPLLAGLDTLPDPQRAMLRSAFGMADHEGGDLFLVALATLGLLTAEASRQSLLITVDDVQWLDAASRDVLAFVARRLDGEAIVLLAASRDEDDPIFDAHPTTDMVLTPLADDAARALLSARAPSLNAELREPLLRAAAGNPLAICELPLTAASPDGLDSLAPMPISARLERTFVQRAQTGRPDAAALALVLAADGTASVAEVVAATEILLGRELAPDTLQAVVDARLVTVSDPGLAFRHPLMRSAIYQSATLRDRRAAHAALARVAGDHSDRRTHHQAAAAEAPDEDVARDLEELGRRALRHGAASQASAALTRAAALSTDPAARVRRLLAAAESAFEAGRADVVRSLVEHARRESLDDQDLARVEWLSQIFDDGSGPGQGSAPRIRHLVALSQRAIGVADSDLALSLLFAAALRCWWGNAAPDARSLVVEATRAMSLPPTEPRRVATIATADPIVRGTEVADLLTQAVAQEKLDPRNAYRLGLAGHAVGDYDVASRLFAVAADGLREQGRLSLLAQTQVMRSVESVVVGDFPAGSLAADEAAGLATETGQPIWLAGATGSRAAIAALRGDIELGRSLAANALSMLEATGSTAVLGWLQIVRGVVELSAGRFDDAYGHLIRTFDPRDPAYHVRDQYTGTAFLADAALGRGDLSEARAIIATLTAQAGTSTIGGLRTGLDYARAILAEDTDAEHALAQALDLPSLSRPFDRARLQLAHGMWLRRQRRVIESRNPLRAARSGFETLNVPTWSDRAQRELRAAGAADEPRRRQAWDDLSPQELQIARLAAQGLSNRQIGQRLYLSHRTVATHLYHAFPKLGIASRTQLATVLSQDRGDDDR